MWVRLKKRSIRAGFLDLFASENNRARICNNRETDGNNNRERYALICLIGLRAVAPSLGLDRHRCELPEPSLRNS